MSLPEIFVDPIYCICITIDVGMGILTYNDEFCPTHGDPDFLITLKDDYDPDMMEDEKPHDIYEIEWSDTYV